MACQDHTDEGGVDIDAVYSVSDFSQALNALHHASEQGKTVGAIMPLFGNNSGWNIMFTDSTSICIIHSQDETDDKMVCEPSLYFCFNVDSLWTLCSFDATQQSRTSPVELSIEQDNAVVSLPDDKRCSNYVMKPVFNIFHNSCSFNFYHHPDSTTPKLLYSKDYSKVLPIVTCIVENQLTRTVTLTMVDGEEICFSKHYDKPEQIVWQQHMPASLCAGDTLVLPFSVSPRQAVFNHNVKSDNCDIRLLALAEDDNLLPSTVFKLLTVRHDYDSGLYQAVITSIHDVDSINSEKLVLQLTTPPTTDSHFSDTLATRPIEVCLQPKGTILRPLSALPVILINTPGHQNILSKEQWLENTDIAIYHSDGALLHQGTTAIRGRGNSSFGFPKMPYALKLNNAAQLLGMPADRRWVLLANWIDRTLLRNDVAFAMARATGMEWVPQGQFVDLIVNNRYVGNYYLCEQVRASSNRLALGADGFLLEIDIYYDEPNRFTSTLRMMPYMVKSPNGEELSDQQLADIRQFIDNLELSLYDNEHFERREYRPFIDFRSFAQFWIVQELTTNHDAAVPKSLYLYRTGQDKLKTVVWDFDYGTFIKCDDYMFNNAFYYDRLFLDPEFDTCVKDVWQQSREQLLYVIQHYIDQQAKLISISQQANHRLWPITGDEKPNQDEDLPFEQAVKQLKQNALYRFNLLDRMLSR